MIYFYFSAAICMFLLFSYIFKLYKIEYDEKSAKHKVLIVLCCTACIFTSGYIFFTMGYQLISYPFDESTLVVHNAYEQQFDAFMKGQLNIDFPVDKRILELENPYIWQDRTETGAHYLWDRSLFEGKYYSYFGIAPILTIYFPFYFIFEKLPSASIVCFVFSIVSIISITLLVLKSVKLLCKKVNLPLLILGILAVNFGSLTFMIQSSADMYYIAVASAICFLSLFLLLFISAFLSQKSWTKAVLFVFSGVSFVLLCLSRPNTAIFCIIVIPMIISVLVSKKYSLRQKIIQAISFAVPTLIGAFFIMYYNYARFDSVLEFGAQYQLTVFDVSTYKIKLELLFPSIYHYFFQFPAFGTAFPYLIIPFEKIVNLNNFYLTSTIGAFSFPSVMGFFLIPSEYIGNKNTLQKSTIGIAVSSVFILAFLNTCLGGVNIRYLADIMLVAVLFSALILFSFYSKLKFSRTLYKFIAYTIISIAFILTIALGFLLIFNNERDNILKIIGG